MSLDSNEVKHPTHDFMSVSLSSAAVKIIPSWGMEPHYMERSKPFASEVSRSTGNANGSFQELVFAARMWESEWRRQAAGTPGAARLAALILGALFNFNQTKQALQR